MLALADDQCLAATNAQESTGDARHISTGAERVIGR